MTPWTGRLLAANVLAFVAQQLVGPEFTRALLLVPAALPSRPWTAVTYMFLHGGLWHLAFNMIALYFFGPRLEVRLGGGRFLALYFVAGLSATLLSWLFAPGSAIIGASGAVFGVMVGFARYWPRDRIYIWGVLPIEARWLVGIMAGMALMGGLGYGEAGIAHFAHLGGFLGGWAFLAVHDRNRGRSGAVKRVFEEQRRKLSAPGRSEVQRWMEIDAGDLHEVNREHLEKLRAKIEEEGAASLGRREREFLERLVRREEEG